MDITVSTLDQGMLVALDGKLDVTTSPRFRERILALIEAGHLRLAIDCALLTYVSSAGLRVFYQALARLEPKGGRIVICRPRPEVRLILNMVDLGTDIPIVATKEEALEQLT